VSEQPAFSICGLVSQIKERRLRASEIVAACLERIERLEPKLQAWAFLDPERSRREAERLDRLADAGTLLPLHGVPVGVKDIIDVAGMPTAAGFEPYRGRIAREDAPIVARLRALGAVILGKTHTTQFAFADPAPTANPWHPERTPGGSSSGSGAAVAARMVPLALGSQTAGSVLRPAAYCGAVGFKPSYGWFTTSGVIPLAWSLDHLGLIACTVQDAALTYVALLEQRVDFSFQPQPPRLLLLTDFPDRSEPAVRANLLETAQAFRDAGAAVEERRLPVDLDLLLAVHHVLMTTEAAAVHRETLAREREHYGPRLRAAVETGLLVPAALELHARRLRAQLVRAIDELLGQADAALLPTVPAPAPGRETTGDRSFQAVWTLCRAPSISLPSGLSPDGLPLAIQFVARQGHDRGLLQVAAWCEQLLPRLPEPPVAAGL
jgi:aspartyl-tRNA(Asn)/glutamyl-tRNA(Gln) amidotransferase subunit A